MHSTQVSVQEIHHPSTFYQYQDTVELQETPLQTKMDGALLQEIKTMMDGFAIVHNATKVPGGIGGATAQTSMVSTMVDHTHLLLMV